MKIFVPGTAIEEAAIFGSGSDGAGGSGTNTTLNIKYFTKD